MKSTTLAGALLATMFSNASANTDRFTEEQEPREPKHTLRVNVFSRILQSLKASPVTPVNVFLTPEGYLNSRGENTEVLDFADGQTDKINVIVAPGAAGVGQEPELMTDRQDKVSFPKPTKEVSKRKEQFWSNAIPEPHNWKGSSKRLWFGPDTQGNADLIIRRQKP